MSSVKKAVEKVKKLVVTEEVKEDQPKPEPQVEADTKDSFEKRHPGAIPGVIYE